MLDLEKITDENPFKEVFAQPEQLVEFVVDPDRQPLRTGLSVRASYQGRWVTADVSQLFLASLELYVQAMGGDWRKFALRLLQHEASDG